ncbi:MAG TPA: type I DNA topoisomerase [Terriglobales bacterium]|nr:type I DNA topoisomerase [Terriglobales bacterium]
MGKNLVIVESPAKTKTLKRFLGKDYQLEASLGHIKNLPQKSLGVKIEEDFKPGYVVIPGRKKVIDKLKKEAGKAEKVYLAPDPDREGEAIAWHVAEEVKKTNPNILRASFNEITKEAVLKGIEKAGPIDMDKVNAQQARRILDRIVGYKVSPFLWKTVYRGLSAGRVQSVALRIICEREEQIQKFVPLEYWSITGWFENQKNESFSAELVKIKGEDFRIENQTKAEEILQDLKRKSYKVASVNTEKRSRNPYPPFITSTLEQDSARRLYFSPQKTMVIAQQLYEGVELGEKGSVGLITYMRTDSVRIADSAKKAARDYIEKNFGSNYLPDRPREYKSKKNSQEAHEAIRPTYVEYPPDEIKKYLSKDQFKLYQLIYNRFLASQMKEAIYDTTTVEIQGDGYTFRASASELRFDGFLKVYQEVKEENGENGEEKKLPVLKQGESLNLLKLEPEQHFTKPPARFSEATLIKELEANGIGRPSTYALIVGTIEDRKYVEKEKKKLFPTELGKTVNRILVENFPELFDVGFTAEMEEELDRIEEGEDDWVKVLKDFYTPFKSILEEAEKKRKEIKSTIQEKTGEVCEKCGSPMVIKWGRHGRFLACSAYPECKNTKPLNSGEQNQITDEKCELCGSPMVLKNGRFGKFLACSRYPECKNTKPYSLGIPCPRGCGGFIVEKKSRKGKIFFGCSNYPKCDFATWDRPVKENCPQCGANFLVLKESKKKGEYLLCLKCKYEKSTTEEKTVVKS